MTEIKGLSNPVYDDLAIKKVKTDNTSVTDKSIQNKSFSSDNILVKNGHESITVSNLLLNIEDIDGIDTNSKNDLNTNLKGNINISKSMIQNSIEDLEKDLKSKFGNCDIKLEVNHLTNEYKITLHKGVDLASINLKMTDGGIDTTIGFSKFLKTTAFIISPLGTLIANPDKLLANFVRTKLSKDIGLTAVPDPQIKNKFKMVPDFKNNKLIKEIPLGNMKVYLEEVKGGKSNFKLDNQGNIVMNLDLDIKASSNPYGTLAKDEESHDKISTTVDAVYNDDKTGEVNIKNINLSLDITESELHEAKKQIQGFGKNISASGKVNITADNEKILLNNNKTIIQDNHNIDINAQNLKVDNQDSKLDLKSAHGRVDYQKDTDGSDVLDIDAENVTGSFKNKNTNLELNNFSINGKVTHKEAKNNQPEIIKIEGQNIKADGIKVDDKIKINKLAITGTNIDLEPKTGNVYFNSKGGKTTIQELQANDRTTIKNLTFIGTVKSEKSGKVTLESNHLTFNGEFSGSKVDISPAKNANFAGKVTYDPKVGITIEGTSKKYADIKNLSGTVGNFEINSLSTKSKVVLDKKGDLHLADTASIKLDAQGMNLQGTNLVVNKNGDVFSLKSEDATFSLSQTRKDKPTQKIADNVLMNGNVVYDSKNKTLTFKNTNAPFKITSGDISGIKFNNFKINGEIQLRDKNNVTIKGPTNFTGSLTVNKNTIISNFNSKGDLTFDEINQKKIVTINDDVSMDLKLSPNKPASHIETKGKFIITDDQGKQSISTKHGVINGNIESAKFNNLDFTGNIKYDNKTKTVSFNNANEPFKINSGSVQNVNFKNFAISGEIIADSNNVVIKGGSSFNGVATLDNTTIKNLKCDSDIVFNNGKIEKSVILKGNAEFEVDIKDKPVKVSTSGDIKLFQGDSKYTFISNNGVINAKFGDLELKDFKFNGKVTYDQKSGEMKLERLNPDSEFKVAGSFNGHNFDISSFKEEQGSLTIKQNGKDYQILADNIHLKGQVDGINFIANDLKGQIDLQNNSKPVFKNLDINVNIEDVNVSIKGDAKKTDQGYELDLSGSFSAEHGKVEALISKISNLPEMKNNPKTLKNLEELKHTLEKFDLNKIKIESLKLNFNNEADYKLSLVTSDIDLSIPEKNLKLTNTPPGKITLNLESGNKVSISSEGTKINASMGNTKLENFNINGTVEFNPVASSEKDAVKFKAPSGNTKIKGLDISGNIIYKDNVKPVNLKAETDVNLFFDKEGFTFEGKNINLAAMFDGISIKNLPTNGIDATNPTFANGKFTIKKDGYIDLSELNFAIDVEGIKLTNNSGTIKTSEEGYQMKISGGVAGSIDNLTKFMEKIAVNSSTPEASKESINRTIKNIKQYIVNANIDEASYKDFTINLDKGFKIKNYQMETKTVITDAKVKMDSLGQKGTMEFDRIEMSATSHSTEGNKFHVREGQLNLPLSENVKAQICNSVKEMIIEGSKMPKEKFKELKVNISPDGLVTVGGTVNFKSIADIKFGLSVGIEGKTVMVSIDKTRLKGFLGLIQSAIQPITGKAENIITDKIVDQTAEKMKMEYSGKGNTVRIDLQGLFNKHVDEKAIINHIEIKDNLLKVTYGASYDGNGDEDYKKINDFVKVLNANKISQEDVDKLLSLNNEELSLVFTKVSIVPDLIKKLGENNTYKIMKSLADNQSTELNQKHLSEFISQTKVPEKIVKSLLQNIGKDNYDNLSPQVKDAFTKRLKKIEFK